METVKAHSVEDTKEFLTKMFEILDALEYDRFHEVFSKDLEHNSGMQKDQGLDKFTENLKQQMQTMPPLRMKHSCDRIDVVHDGLVYAAGHTKVLFEAEPDSAVTIPVMGVFSRVANGPEIGKISVMTIYEDHVPFMQKVQAMMK